MRSLSFKSKIALEIYLYTRDLYNHNDSPKERGFVYSCLHCVYKLHISKQQIVCIVVANCPQKRQIKIGKCHGTVSEKIPFITRVRYDDVAMSEAMFMQSNQAKSTTR